jgi:Zn-dependent protease with chaperone function
MPNGLLRMRLLETARRLHFRCNNILVWHTRGHVANAMVAGILPWLRYVLFTDRLLADLTPDEVEAVFGHEVGHVKHHHIPYYLSFLIISLTALWAGARTFLGHGEVWYTDHQTLVLLTIMGSYIFVVFGFLSRRCKRQADIFGCRAVSCNQPHCSGHDPSLPLPDAGKGLCQTGIRTFIQALEKVGTSNGINRNRPGWLQSWQHSTIARRVEFLKQVLENPILERRFQWRVFIVKVFLLVGVASICFLLIHFAAETL